MWLIKASLRNPYMVATIVFVMMVLGILAMFSIPVDILPVFKSPAVEVLTYYQGMPASSVEKTITNRIERWTSQAPGAARVESKSVPGVSVVKLFFRDDIDPNGALTLTNSLALGTLPTLPPNTLPPVVLPFDPTGTMPLGILTVKNKHLDEARVKDLARIDVRSMLGAVPGVVAPVVVGGKDRTVLIYLDPKKLQAKNLSPTNVVEALRNGNLMVTPGTVYFGDNQILLDSDALLEKVKDFNSLPIRIEPNNNVYLRDVGWAEDSYAIQTSRVRIDGRSQVYVPIYRQGGASSLDVANGVKEAKATMEERLEPGSELEFVMDQSFYVKQSIKSLVQEGIVGAILVSIMILIFLGNFRMTVIASLSIPLAVLGAIACLYASGNTINLMTLSGLALAIGPLVDDAIVELENNHRNYHLGKSRARAALDGCAEVMVPVMVATCTTILVLSPLALMPGMAGFLFRPLALAVAFAMLCSFLLSRTFVPMMCCKFLPDEHRSHGGVGSHRAAHDDLANHGWFGRFHVAFNRFLDRQVRGYERLLNVFLKHRLKFLSFVLVLFLGALCLLPSIGREYFPQVDAGQITMYVRCPSDLRLDASEKRIAEVEKLIESVIPTQERETIVSELGLDPDWSAAYTANSGQQDTVIRIQLNVENQTRSAQDYAKMLREKFAAEERFADLRVSFDTGGMVSTALNFGVSSPLDIQVEGGNSEAAMKLAQQVRQEAEKVHGAADVQIAQRLDAPYLVIDINRQKAANVGLSARDVIEQVVAAMNSSVSIERNFWIDLKSGNQYFVGVQYEEDPNATIEKLNNIPITGKDKTSTVTLSSLVQIHSRTDAVEINHVSLYRTFNVRVNTQDRDIGGVTSDFLGRLKELQKQSWETALAAAHKKADDKELTADQHEEAVQALKDLTKEYSKVEADNNVSLVDRVQRALKGKADFVRFPGGLRVRPMGEYSRMNDAFGRLVWGLGLAIVLVYLLQVALFRSWVGPFIIMFTVPLGIMGVLTMLYLTHTTLNVQSLMGMIFLVGIEVNTGVLMVEFANKQRRLGLSVRDSITTAATIRFRPIMMTFLATFFDLVPMALGLERGSEATVPLARAVIGGLVVSTLLGRFVLPVLYTLLIREGNTLEAEAAMETELADRPDTAIHKHTEEPTTDIASEPI